jgi:pimeloyl-ACP methyl ester carboxylesterase
LAGWSCCLVRRMTAEQELLAEGARFVIRYDHRDTGRSVTYEPRRPGYTAADLVADAVGVLHAYEVAAAHVVGVSAGGAFAQLLALGFPEACSRSSSSARLLRLREDAVFPRRRSASMAFWPRLTWIGRIRGR